MRGRRSSDASGASSAGARRHTGRPGGEGCCDARSSSTRAQDHCNRGSGELRVDRRRDREHSDRHSSRTMGRTLSGVRGVSMLTLHWRQPLCWLSVLALLSACSNGRGSVEEGSRCSGDAERIRRGWSRHGARRRRTRSAKQRRGRPEHRCEWAVHLAGGARGAAPPTASRFSTQPSNPPQTCTIANGAGSIAGSDVTNIVVTCASSAFSVRGVGHRTGGFRAGAAEQRR